MNVFLSFDTEVWQFYDNFDANYNSSIFGATKDGAWGLQDQLTLLNDYGLKATFFVDPLFTLASGIDPLAKVTDAIQKANQDAQLHMHTEWLKLSNKSLWSEQLHGHNMKNFSYQQQCDLLGHGLDVLRQAGSNKVTTFRAGNYGANNTTFDALESSGIPIDSSLNQSYLSASCAIRTNNPMHHPSKIGNTIEFPISQFQDGTNEQRHLQLAACSFSEIQQFLDRAERSNYSDVVMVLHSFEWIQRRNFRGHLSHALDGIVRRRFVQLCELLANQRARYTTCHFGEVDPTTVDTNNKQTIKTGIFPKIRRLAEQGLRTANKRLAISS